MVVSFKVSSSIAESGLCHLSRSELIIQGDSCPALRKNSKVRFLNLTNFGRV